MKDLSSIVAKFKVQGTVEEIKPCLLYTSDAADE